MRRVAVAVVGAIFCISQSAAAQDASSFCDVLHVLPQTAVAQQVQVLASVSDDASDLKLYLSGQAAARFRSATQILQLTASEVQDLQARAQGFTFDGFKPKCEWTKHATDDGLTRLRISRPLFSSDSKIGDCRIDGFLAAQR